MCTSLAFIPFLAALTVSSGHQTMRLMRAAPSSASSVHATSQATSCGPVSCLGTRHRTSTVRMAESDWSSSPAATPFSDESVEVLLRYGPEAWLKRWSDSKTYDFDVNRVQRRYRISRALAEQEVNKLNSDPVGYIAAQTQQRQKDGPSESELLRPLTAKEKTLAIVWGGAALLLVAKIAVALVGEVIA
mmetsp:Transcript_30554/g.66960  ORF Transcript_30554/g.66960 Transcript_30554/m.66960 type:complete len:189 (+) Transcript_30554:194-760(+)